jgi:hypothetical protein
VRRPQAQLEPVADLNPGVSTDPRGYTCDGERWWGSNYGVHDVDAAGAVDILGPDDPADLRHLGQRRLPARRLRAVLQRHLVRHALRRGRGGARARQNPGWTPAQVRAG